MSDSFIQPPANTGTGLLVDTEQLTVGANTVQRQRIIIADPATAAAKVAVSQFGNQDANAATTYGIQVGGVIYLFNGTTFDRWRAATGTTGIAAVNSEGTKATYSAAGLLTPAATASDVAILNGSGSKTVRVTRVEVSIAATAAGIVDALLIKRSTANTGGTSSAPTVVPNDANDAAGTATVLQYSANPTVGSIVGNVRAQKMGILANGVVTANWDFTVNNSKGIILRGVAQGLAINLNGDVLLTGEVVGFSFQWTEE